MVRRHLTTLTQPLTRMNGDQRRASQVNGDDSALTRLGKEEVPMTASAGIVGTARLEMTRSRSTWVHSDVSFRYLKLPGSAGQSHGSYGAEGGEVALTDDTGARHCSVGVAAVVEERERACGKAAGARDELGQRMKNREEAKGMLFISEGGSDWWGFDS
ncbi:hypothetical protein OsI_38189 [Oryza sativa Indica Group]|uniref:Uncharacterized protein n=1 Tax=Oryza sativa subsp. indica TaxID=39946 RepID=B8BPF0_ORYSI|nr:hypothetical protein OsI_38189 [Oryza sativa Indica Group]